LVLVVVARLFTFGFISLFIYSVVNVATAIMLGSFAFVREQYAIHDGTVDTHVTRVEKLATAKETVEDLLGDMAALMESIAANPDSDTELPGEFALEDDGYEDDDEGDLLPTLTVQPPDAGGERLRNNSFGASRRFMARASPETESDTESPKGRPPRRKRRGRHAPPIGSSSDTVEGHSSGDELPRSFHPENAALSKLWVERNVIF
jgi:hypothetical protein